MATRLFTVDLDLGLNKARRFIFEDFNTTPSNGSNAGRVIYWTAGDSAANHLKVYNGTSWKTLAYTDDIPPVSISLDAATGFNVTGSPADANGTLTFEWDVVAPNTVLAGLQGGTTSMIPTFRALVDADIPVEIARVDDVNTSLEDYILLTEKGEPLGVAELDASGFVPLSQLNIDEAVQDAIGTAIVTNGSHAGIAVLYDDAGNGIDFYNTGIVTIEGTTDEVTVLVTGTTGALNAVIGLPNSVTISSDLTIGGSGANSFGTLSLSDNAGNVKGTLSLVDSATDYVSLSSTGYLVINGTSGEYLNSYGLLNQIATIGDIANAANTFSNVDGNLDITTSGTAVTIDLATNITVSGYVASATYNGNGASASLFDDAPATITIGTATSDITIGGQSGTVTIGDALVVTGDLTVNGTTTTLNTETLAVEDNIVLLNSNVTGTPTANAGIEVERGTSANASLFWNESSNRWSVNTPGDPDAPLLSHAIARKYVATTTGTTHTVSHYLGTSDVTVSCWVSGEQIEANVVVTDDDTVTVTTNSSLTVKTVVVG